MNLIYMVITLTYIHLYSTKIINIMPLSPFTLLFHHPPSSSLYSFLSYMYSLTINLIHSLSIMVPYLHPTSNLSYSNNHPNSLYSINAMPQIMPHLLNTLNIIKNMITPHSLINIYTSISCSVSHISTSLNDPSPPSFMTSYTTTSFFKIIVDILY